MALRLHPKRVLAALLGVLSLLAGTLMLAPAPARAATPVCQVDYSMVNSWPTGFQSAVTVTNNGATLTSWSVGFQFSGSQTITNGWSGVYTQNGKQVTIANASYNGAIATGGSVTLGFVASNSGANTNPTYFTLNGVACNGSPQLPAVSLTSPVNDA